MKQTKWLLFLILAMACFWPIMAGAEQINGFQTEIKVQPDSALIIKEVITYDFGIPLKHGIYRNIPYQYQTDQGQRELKIKVLSVTNSAGEPINYLTSTIEGGLYSLKIGDTNKTVNGEKIYVITYQVKGAINYFADHDELYWNSTGNEWLVNMTGLIKTKVFLPNNYLVPEKINYACYTGISGAQEKDCSVSLETNSIAFTYNKPELLTGQGMTVVVGWPKGLVKGQSQLSKWWEVIRQFLPLLFPIIIFIFLYRHWKKYGKDPAGRGTIIAEYEAPKNMLPAEGGVVIDEKMDTRDITATVIDLARRGYFKLVEIEKKVLGFNTGKDWKLIKEIGKAQDNLNDYEQELYKALFGSKDESIISELKGRQDVAEQIKKMKKLVYENVASKGWFSQNPDKARAKFIGIGIAIITGLFFVGAILEIFPFGAIMLAAIIISAALFLIFGKHMPQKTNEGALAKEYLEGFKLFLGVTEKDRVSFHFSPQAHPEKFAEYLPWAIIFGVEKEWAEVFKGIDLPVPDWYQGNWSGMYSAMILSDALHSFDSNFGKTMSAMGASAAAKGMSGFGGGGFSGGGFGGGGGGSW